MGSSRGRGGARRANSTVGGGCGTVNSGSAARAGGNQVVKGAALGEEKVEARQSGGAGAHPRPRHAGGGTAAAVATPTQPAHRIAAAAAANTAATPLHTAVPVAPVAPIRQPPVEDAPP